MSLQKKTQLFSCCNITKTKRAGRETYMQTKFRDTSLTAKIISAGF